MLAGLTYALGGAMTARIWAGHFSFVETNAWLPFATGLAIQIGRRHAISLLGVVVGLMLLAGQPEVVIFSVWWLPLWAVAAEYRRPGGRPLRALVRVGLGLALAAGLSAFQVIPVLQFLASSNRQAGMSWDFLTGASLPPWHILTLFGPLVFGDPRGPAPSTTGPAPAMSGTSVSSTWGSSRWWRQPVRADAGAGSAGAAGW